MPWHLICLPLALYPTLSTERLSSQTKHYYWLLDPSQISKYVEHEILNHRALVHPHIVQFHQVRAAGRSGAVLATSQRLAAVG